MKLFFDTNLSSKLVKYLSELYPNSIHAEDTNLDEVDDPIIWDYCKNNKFTIVTKDKDFFDLSSMFGSPPKVILIKRGNCPTEEIFEILKNFHSQFNHFYESEKIHCAILH